MTSEMREHNRWAFCLCVIPPWGPSVGLFRLHQKPFIKDQQALSTYPLSASMTNRRNSWLQVRCAAAPPVCNFQPTALSSLNKAFSNELIHLFRIRRILPTAFIGLRPIGDCGSRAEESFLTLSVNMPTPLQRPLPERSTAISWEAAGVEPKRTLEAVERASLLVFKTPPHSRSAFAFRLHTCSISRETPKNFICLLLSLLPACVRMVGLAAPSASLSVYGDAQGKKLMKLRHLSVL